MFPIKNKNNVIRDLDSKRLLKTKYTLIPSSASSDKFDKAANSLTCMLLIYIVSIARTVPDNKRFWYQPESHQVAQRRL